MLLEVGAVPRSTPRAPEARVCHIRQPLGTDDVTLRLTCRVARTKHEFDAERRRERASSQAAVDLMVKGLAGDQPPIVRQAALLA